MASPRNNLDPDEQLDLFRSQRPTNDTIDAIRPNGRETLARALPRDGARTGAEGLVHQMLLEAEQRTKDDMANLRIELIKQGKTAQQAHDQAWEMVREKYILLPPES